MLHQFESVSIEETISIKGNPCLNFIFKGKLTEKASMEAAQKWEQIFESNTTKKYDLLWDCTHMNGFESGARTQWYSKLSMYKRRINHITTISNNIMIRSAAKVMLDFFKIENSVQKPVSTLKERKQRSIFLSIF